MPKEKTKSKKQKQTNYNSPVEDEEEPQTTSSIAPTISKQNYPDVDFVSKLSQVVQKQVKLQHSIAIKLNYEAVKENIWEDFVLQLLQWTSNNLPNLSISSFAIKPRSDRTKPLQHTVWNQYIITTDCSTWIANNKFILDMITSRKEAIDEAPKQRTTLSDSTISKSKSIIDAAKNQIKTLQKSSPVTPSVGKTLDQKLASANREFVQRMNRIHEENGLSDTLLDDDEDSVNFSFEKEKLQDDLHIQEYIVYPSFDSKEAVENYAVEILYKAYESEDLDILKQQQSLFAENLKYFELQKQLHEHIATICNNMVAKLEMTIAEKQKQQVEEAKAQEEAKRLAQEEAKKKQEEERRRKLEQFM